MGSYYRTQNSHFTRALSLQATHINMFARLSIVSVLALGLLAAATPAPVAHKRWAVSPTTVTVTATATATSVPVSLCSTGDIQCCNSVTAVCAHAVDDDDATILIVVVFIAVVVAFRPPLPLPLRC